MVFAGESGQSLVVRGEGLVLREWDEADAPAMVEMFDTAEMDRWRPLAHPFSPEVAADVLHMATWTRPV